MTRVGVVRCYQVNETDAMTYMWAGNDEVQFDFIGTHEVKCGTLGSFVHENNEAGWQSILDQHYDILDLPDPHYDWAVWLALRHPHYVCTVWENLPWQMIDDNWRAMLMHADMVIARSPLTYFILKDLGIDDKRLKLIPAAVDTELFKPTNDKANIVLYPGRLTAEKGCWDLMFASWNQPWKMVFAGDGPSFDAMATIAEQLAMDNIMFLGQVRHQDMPEIMNKCRVVAYPSWPTFNWQEQFGVSVIEAAACGCKLILSEQNVFRWLGEHINYKEYVAPGDIQGMRKAIQFALDQYDSKVSTLSDDYFEAHNVGKQIRQLYNGLG